MIIGNFILQIAGKPKEKVFDALKVIEENLKKSKDFKLLESEVVEPEKKEGDVLYSGFVDARIEFENTERLLNFVLDYLPVSIEVEGPEEIILKSYELNGILNDVAKHMLDSVNKIRHLSAYIHSLHKKR